jgi:hypothetical protein
MMALTGVCYTDSQWSGLAILVLAALLARKIVIPKRQVLIYR